MAGLDGGNGVEGSAQAGLAGGDGNHVMVFNDTLIGSAGGDTLFGDLDLRGVRGTATSETLAGSGGDGDASSPGGAGGEADRVIAFCERLDGGSDDDYLVGDIQVFSSVGAIDQCQSVDHRRSGRRPRQHSS